MTIYHFDVREGDHVTRDEEGRQCADPAAVQAWAVRVACGVIGAEAAMGRLRVDCRIQVRDSADRLVRVMPFFYAIDVQHG